MHTHTIFSFVCVVLLLLLTNTSAHAAPKADLWPKWQTNNAGSTTHLDHSAWSTFLKKYTVKKNEIVRVKYRAVTPADKQTLNAYINQLSQQPVTRLNSKEQKAFWINAYNALTIKTVLDAYPVTSIRKIKFGGLFASGPWDEQLITIEGVKLSLNDIEHRILRPIWKDPRVHYAVNCASIGCPNLQQQAFTHENIDSLLSKGARDYINSSRGVRISGDDITASSIYTWFKEDFGSNDANIIAHWSQYARPALKSALTGKTRINKYQYNWSLNEE